jgi:outer membrane protein OmpA-like peptidoglycan-associated protein
MREALALVILLVTSWPGSAAAAPSNTPSGTAKVLDLVFHVEDTGGIAESLQVQETATEVRIDLPADILFDFDKADILPRAQKALHQAAAIIQQRATGPVRIEGHTDSKGSPAYNQRLSDRRAVAVKDWLVTKEALRGVAFMTQGFGATRPKVPNMKPDGSDDPHGRQQNRRVEIVLTKK